MVHLPMCAPVLLLRGGTASALLLPLSFLSSSTAGGLLDHVFIS